MVDHIKLDFNSRVPKYTQLIEAIIHNIYLGNVKTGDKVPSINTLSEEFYLSRNTVERAFKELKKQNVLASYPGRGTFIAKSQVKAAFKILFLVNKLSPFKMKIFKSFTEELGKNYNVDLQCYHCDESLFLELLKKAKYTYDYFVIIPHFRTESLRHISVTENTLKALNTLPKNKLVFLDNKIDAVENVLIESYQDYEKDLITSLEKEYEKLSKYKKVVLVYPLSVFYPYPHKIKSGFIKYCVKYNFDFQVIEEVGDAFKLSKDTLYITIEESDLVSLVHQIRKSNLVLGENVGLISYNDTSLKELLEISVLTTNFKKMGKKTAKFIKEGKRKKLNIPFKLITRSSI